jgi:transcriptional regulator with XRE-family HTH domain
MSRIERGKANPSLDSVEIVAGGLKVTVAKLFEDI